MKYCIFFTVLACFVIGPVLSAEQQNNNPILVFFVNHETEPEKDFIEITLEIQAKDTSLIIAINSGAATVQQISNMANSFCDEFKSKAKSKQCENVVDAGNFEIQPRYQVVKRSPVFIGFTVIHQMTIAVTSISNIGNLVDKILTKTGVTLKTFEWKAKQDSKTHEEAIGEGMQQAEGLCAQLGLKLGRIISIQQVNDDEIEGEQQQQEQEEQEEQQQQEQEEEDVSALFRFEVECTPKTKSKKQ